MQEINRLTLNKVVLFKIGIGSFLKKGVIDLEKQKSVKISFKKSVINDLLKTFSILRVSGDLMVSGISYEAKNTDRQKLLEDSKINLPEQNTFLTLIRQLRGITVKISIKQQTIEGKILGTQMMNDAPLGTAIIDQFYLLLYTDNQQLEKISISDIDNLEILDDEIDKDLSFFLETIIGQNKEKNTLVTLFFEGKEKSEYIINFLQEVPAWKTSYRLFIYPQDDENDKDSFERKASIQGWAIIDNVLDEDWENVDLTLVTGLPVSFIYDSYSPAWISRPRIERKTDLGVKVVQYDRTLETSPRKKAARPPSAPPLPSSAPAGPPGGPPAAIRGGGDMKLFSRMRGEIATLAMDADDEFMYEEEEEETTFEASAEVEGGKGLAFKYHIGTPVFVKRNNSSLIPLLQGDVEGEIIAIYNKNVNAKHPMTTFAFKNQTGLTLEEGPISIFMQNVFAGEAMLSFIESGENCKVPYALDQSVEINMNTRTLVDHVHKIDIKSRIYQYFFSTKVFEYKLNNFDENPKKLIIEHPISRNYELYDTSEPNETTYNFHRFNILLNSKQKVTFTIKERSVMENYEYLENVDEKKIQEWVKSKLIDKDESEYLKKRIKLLNEYNAISKELSNIEEKRNMIYTEQERLRENLKALQDSKSERNLRDKYITKFDERETELEDLKNREIRQIKERDIKQVEIDDLDSVWNEKIKKKEGN